jgi:hypothetical protein
MRLRLWLSLLALNAFAFQAIALPAHEAQHLAQKSQKSTTETAQWSDDCDLCAAAQAPLARMDGGHCAVVAPLSVPRGVEIAVSAALAPPCSLAQARAPPTA